MEGLSNDLLNLCMQKPYVIGIAGGSGSGKTTFINHLCDTFKEGEVCLLSMDNFYKKREEQALDENNQIHFDLPTSFRREEFARDLGKLIQGESVQFKEYTFNNPLAKAKDICCRPAPIIVVEGIFVFYFEEIAKLMDLKIFLEANEHLKLIRRIKRDAKERNYPLEDVLYRYQHHVYPSYEHYILPSKSQADIIINNNNNFDGALQMFVSFLKEKLKGHSLS